MALPEGRSESNLKGRTRKMRMRRAALAVLGVGSSLSSQNPGSDLSHPWAQ